jgi:hypothetical protein
VLTSEENSGLCTTLDTELLARACCWAALVSDPLVPATLPARALHSPAAVCGMLAGDELSEAGEDAAGGWVSPDEDAEGDADPESDGDGMNPPAGGVTGAATLLPPYAGPELEPELEKVPVLAASATPPPAPTASTEARTLTVSILASGDLIICSLRKFATDARWFASNAATAICSPASSSS